MLSLKTGGDGRATTTTDEMMTSKGIDRVSRAPNRGFGVVNAGIMGPWENGGQTPGPAPQTYRQSEMGKVNTKSCIMIINIWRWTIVYLIA